MLTCHQGEARCKTATHTEANQFFQHLKWVLQLEHVAGQDVVVIEKVPVWLVEAREVPGLDT